eukprot:359240-Chlamydomonas_euryale.AAC.9
MVAVKASSDSIPPPLGGGGVKRERGTWNLGKVEQPAVRTHLRVAVKALSDCSDEAYLLLWKSRMMSRSSGTSSKYSRNAMLVSTRCCSSTRSNVASAHRPPYTATSSTRMREKGIRHRQSRRVVTYEHGRGGGQGAAGTGRPAAS